MKKIFFVIPFFAIACSKKGPADNSYTGMLTGNISRAKDDLEKIKGLGQLAIYYIDVDPGKSDSVMQSAYDIAFQSKMSNQEPLIVCYLLDAERQLVLYDYRNRLMNISIIAAKAQKLATDNGLLDYLAFSYLYQAQAARFSGNFKDALGWCKKAKDIAETSKSDSLQLEAYSTNSQVSQSLRLLNDALRDASRAYLIAEKTENKNLKLEAYRRLAYLYEDFDSTACIDNYKKFIDLSLELDNKEQLVWGYIGLSRHYALKPESFSQAAKYLEEAEKIVSAIHHESLLTAVRFATLDYYIKTGQIKTMYAALHNWEISMAGFYRKNGLQASLYFEYTALNYNLGKYFRKNNDPATADRFFTAAVADSDSTLKFYSKNAAVQKQSDIYFYKGASNHALYFLHKYDAEKSLDNKDSVYRKLSDYFYEADDNLVYAQDIYVMLNNPEYLSNILQWRENLIRDSAIYYHKMFRNPGGTNRWPTLDFAEKAWLVRNKYDSCDKVCQLYKDSKDQAIIINERERREKEIAQEKEEHLEKTKIAGIIFSLVLVFIALIAGGYLRVSLGVTKGLNFFAFIFLFEFILLLTEKWVHGITHGEMVRSLAIKITLAAFLVPLHHFLEKKVIQTIRERAEARAI